TAKAIFLRCRRRRLLVFCRFLRRGWRWWETLSAAVQPPIRHFNRHEEKVFVNRYVVLSAGTDHRSQQTRLRWIGDVVDTEAVKVSLKEMIALESNIRVGESELSNH